MVVGIERLLQDEPLRLRMGENAVRDAVKRFDFQRQADFLRWYEQILRRVTLKKEIAGAPSCVSGIEQ